MADTDLQGFILLLPNEGLEPELNAIRCKIHRAIESNIKLTEHVVEKPDTHKKYVFYEEKIYKADINFGPIQNNEIRKQNILARFCHENVMSGIGETWLYLETFEINEMIHESKPNLTNFAFGSIVHMNTFVEHFSSEWSVKDESCRITQTTVHFKHDIRKLEVNFMVTDQILKRGEKKNLDNCQLHMLELDYSMILRILIEVEKQPLGKNSGSGIQVVRLYLVMNGAPLVKVRELKDEEKEDQNSINITDKEYKWSYPLDKEVVRDQKHYRAYENDNRGRNGQHFSNGNRQAGHHKHNNGYKNDSDALKKDPSKVWKLEERNKIKSYVSADVVDDKMVYRRTAFFGKEKTSAYCSSKTIGLCRVLRLDIRSPHDNQNEVWETLTQLVCCCREAQVYFTPMKQHVQKNELPYPSISHSHFDCVYALKTITSPSYTIVDEVNIKETLNSMNRLLKKFAEIHPKALEKTLFEIQAMGDKGDVFRFKSALQSLMFQNTGYFESILTRKGLPENTVLLRRAILTPTRVVFLPPIAHMKSYLLRKTFPDFALRITIRDDNFDQLTYTIKGTEKNQTTFLKTFIGEKLLKGFTIGKRDYQFFGASSSQLREHGCLFYSEDLEKNTAETIRSSLGDLHAIKNVAKYMARMGQSLSQAMSSVTLPREFVEGPVPDAEFDGYTFSDGVGKMSQEVAEMAYKALKLDPNDKPCAMQIRYGGCKGMLLLDPNLKGKRIVLRESMWKFNSNNDSLEILKMSRPQPAYLNRPFVTILEQMGIPKQVFFKLQSEQLQQIIHSLYKSSDAVDMLKDEAVLRLPFQTLQKCGIDLAMEPFFRPMIMALYRNAISVLKSKCRIKLPFSKARTMLGVMDETDTLEYGQIFVQYTNDFVEGKPTKEATVLKGTILVTKNPCMHPGDVRKFEAVDVEALKHVRDCIVFPAKGPRPHPDEMAGSDLDGDEYCIIWYDDLIFARDNHEAMDYSNDIPPKRVEKIQVEDMVSFMCDYIRDDCVGLIASAHLAWADSISIFDSKCIDIAKKYSVTLDFAKSGKPDKLDKSERIYHYPDFMEKFREKDCYLSSNALGYLYRNCRQIEMVSNILSDEVPVEIDPVLVYKGWQTYETNARQSLDEYIHLFSTPTRLFRLTNEGEIMTGAVKKLEKSFQGKNIEKNIAKILELVIPTVMGRMKCEFYKEFANDPTARNMIQGNTKDEQVSVILSNYAFQHFKQAANKVRVEPNDLLNKMLQKASAWYKVSYESKKEGSTLYLGLPWVVPELMGILYSVNKAQNVSHKPTLQIKIGRFLEEQKKSLHQVLGEIPSEDAAALSSQIMLKWLRESAKALITRKIQIRELEKELKLQMGIINKGEDVLNTSADKLIYLHFTRLADSYAKVNLIEDRNTGQAAADRYANIKKIGLLAIVALSSLSSTGKLWDGESQSDSNSPNLLGLAFLTREFREEIRFPLNPNGKHGQSEFKKIVVENTNQVAELLKRHSRVTSLEIAFKETKVGNIWYVFVSAYGRAFNIESLKDMVVQPHFQSLLIQAVKDDCCIM